VVREELAKYLNAKACPVCEGTRLRPEARHVKVDDRAIYEVSGLPLKQTLEFFRQLKLPGAKQAIAEKIVNEIVARLSFLNNVGLDYLSLDRGADTLSGARLNASGSPARSARDSPASCTCSTNPRSACTSATTLASSPRSSTCATSATPSS